MVITLMLLLDMVPSPSADVATRIAWTFFAEDEMGRMKHWEYFWTVVEGPGVI